MLKHLTFILEKYSKGKYSRDKTIEDLATKGEAMDKLIACQKKKIDELNAREMTVVENVMVNSAVGFEIGKSTIHYTQKAGLLNLVEMVKGTDTKLVVVGYADAKTGSKSRNLKLSEERANAVKKFLVDNGVKEENVTVEFKGDTEQLYSENEVNRVVVLSK